MKSVKRFIRWENNVVRSIRECCKLVIAVSKRLHHVAILVISVVALCFSFWSIVKRDYVAVTSPIASEVIRGELRVEGAVLRDFSSCVVRLESDGIVRESRESFPVVWDSTAFPDGFYTTAVQVFANIFFIKTCVQTRIVTFQIDNTPPEITIAGLAEGEAIRGTKEVDINVEEGTLEEVSLDGSYRFAVPRSESFQLPLRTNSLSDGNHTITIVAIDRAGNRSQRSISFVVDNTPPRICLPGVAEASVVSGLFMIAPNLEEPNLVEVEVFIDNEKVSQELAFQLNTAALQDGEHRVCIRARDASGNTSEETAVICVDNTLPVLHWLQPLDRDGAQLYHNSQLRLKVDASEPVRLEYFVNGKAIEGDLLFLSDYETGSALTLEAIGLDDAGNQTRITQEVLVSNSISSLILAASYDASRRRMLAAGLGLCVPFLTFIVLLGWISGGMQSLA